MIKNILITGGNGFIGANFIQYFCKKYSHYNIINVDSLTYAANLEVNLLMKKFHNYYFVKGDIADRECIDKIFKRYNIDSIIHFAAESHVDNSIRDPGIFMKTNIMGTYILLEVANRYWNNFNNKELSSCRFHHVSTDEVYGSLDIDNDDYFKENTPYNPSSPYSASKAGSDMIVKSYHRTYGMNVVVTNCSNNFGPYQHDEKFIPTIIRNIISKKPIPIYGDGKNIRDWLYVKDHCMAIDLVFHKGGTGESYNVGAKNERTNLEIVKLIYLILNKLNLLQGVKYESCITFVKDRLGHDRRYAIDSSKIINELKWKPEFNFDVAMEETVKWYLNKYGVR
ncbi:TPA: dTDP-glucose 4,6-dehydratase [Campylobacter jejuni]|uniref:dTDP-glucose 4,6-dehydratase n=1 Tax=Campylobacter jejuni TaxID=197 RepID=UPI000F810327|nr:dTDP-glucose 4,6-dehydratase [Campylobacter jejuni]RTJ93412.1 dTDP-glucose 4,6-dehydratase [Campylobacter jejuni]HEG7018166.1 dTDP-glucose 4,6-dehydratase [Campylobacter jejuni]